MVKLNKTKATLAGTAFLAAAGVAEISEARCNAYLRSFDTASGAYYIEANGRSGGRYYEREYRGTVSGPVSPAAVAQIRSELATSRRDGTGINTNQGWTFERRVDDACEKARDQVINRLRTIIRNNPVPVVTRPEPQPQPRREPEPVVRRPAPAPQPVYVPSAPETSIRPPQICRADEVQPTLVIQAPCDCADAQTLAENIATAFASQIDGLDVMVVEADSLVADDQDLAVRISIQNEASGSIATNLTGENSTLFTLTNLGDTDGDGQPNYGVIALGENGRPDVASFVTGRLREMEYAPVMENAPAGAAPALATGRPVPRCGM